MTSIPKLGSTCPGESSFYVCTNQPTRFVGCCAVNPCHTPTGQCPDDDDNDDETKPLIVHPDDMTETMAQSRLHLRLATRAEAGGLSNVAVAGIAVVATLVGGGLICLAFWWFWRRRRGSGGRESNRSRSGTLPSSSYEPFAGANRKSSTAKGDADLDLGTVPVDAYHSQLSPPQAHLDPHHRHHQQRHLLEVSPPQPSPSQWSDLSYGAPGGGNPLAYSTPDLSGAEYYGAMPGLDPGEDKQRAELAAGGRRAHMLAAGEGEGDISGFTRTYSADMGVAKQPAVGELVG